MPRKTYLKKIRRIVIKVGSKVLTDGRGRLWPPVFFSLVRQAVDLIGEQKEVVLVSSGAIAGGRSILSFQPGTGSIPEKQALAAVGQTHLMGLYQQALDFYGRQSAQVLLTRDDLTHRARYLHARNTLFTLLRLGVIPVVNENDTVMVEEIKFGDNDNLSALVAILVEADLLVLLTSAPGLYSDLNGIEEGALPIPFVERVTPEIQKMASGPLDELGTGGMVTKLRAVRIATQAGIPAVIANGRCEDVMREILAGKPIGTFFAPTRDRLTHKKHWIAYTLRKKGDLVLDEGAVEAIVGRGKSLLPSGVASVQGNFDNGEMVGCLDPSGREIARGITHYSAQEIRRILGKRSSQIEAVLGYRIQDEIIHRDELVLMADAAGKARVG
ncbi:MAG: glutamate 5-kinase [bacterium]